MALAGRVAVVTGSAMGIGRETAILFGEEGATVIALDRDAEANKRLVEEMSGRGNAVEALTVDLSDRRATTDAAAEICSRYPVIDVVFNNAGATRVVRLAKTDDALWDEMLEVNASSAFVLTKGLLDSVRRASAGSIINNASVDGLLTGPAPAYSVAKTAMIGLTRAMACEFGPLGIRANAIASGGIDTAIVARTLESSEAGESAQASRLAQAQTDLILATPLRRWGRADEVARVALFFASDASSFVTGAVLTVDGGRTCVTPGVTEFFPRD